MMISGRMLFPEGVEWAERQERRPRPSEWDDFWFEAQPYANSTGLNVNEDTALTYFAVWACRKVISEDVGSLPLFIYRRSGSSKEVYRDHPLYYLLHDAPNDEMSAMQFRETLQGHVLSFGNGYAQIQRNLRGEIMGLWPLNPSPEKMNPKRDGNNRLIYEYRLENGQKQIFPKEEIFHLAGWGFNGLIGYSPIKYHAETIGCGLAEQQFQGDTFKNGAFPSIAVSHPAPKAPNPEGRREFREELAREYQGRGNRGKIMTLWEGMKAEKLSMTLEDAQLIESRKLTWLQVCAIHRVPPHKVMNLFHATFSNIENQDIDYAKSTIRPCCVRWEQAINQQLLNGSGIFYAEHSLDGLVRGDILTRYQAFGMGIQWGFLSVNECREKENLNPVEGGDTHLQPLNMAPLGSESVVSAAPEAPITDEEKEQAAYTIRQLRLIRRT